ncbi:phytanoyl-CoA dioxygenase family protein [Streptomyces griseofuscus]|uniref:phytanoyl-CoA dioxygenase family protein n=1 Tax=Streptomyces griseofuscus TaxID=146922 RepID=UPI0036FAAAAC
MHALDATQLDQYAAKGYLVVENVLSASELQELREVTDSFAAQAGDENADRRILDIGEHEGRPYVRRVKSPHRHHPVYDATVRHPRILDIVAGLLGDDLRLYGSKINLKLPSGTGDAIQWHQDWGFYPHTNDSLVAVGVLLDDMTEENGPILVVPGSHLGEVYSHNQGGRFAGALDHTQIKDMLDNAVQLTAPAGSITLHHVRAVHASGPNRSTGSRRIIFQNYAAADAWPLVGCGAPGDRHLCAGGDWDAYQDLLVRGQDRQVRLASVPVHLPLPGAQDSSSVFTTQSGADKNYFASSGAME